MTLIRCKIRRCDTDLVDCRVGTRVGPPQPMQATTGRRSVPSPSPSTYRTEKPDRRRGVECYSRRDTARCAVRGDGAARHGSTCARPGCERGGPGWGRQQARFGIHHGDKRPRREILRRHESTERPPRPRLATPCSTPTWPAPPPPAREQEQARAHPRACPWPLELRGAHPRPVMPRPVCPEPARRRLTC